LLSACNCKANINKCVCCLQRYGKDFSVTNLDKEKQIATLSSGKKIQYDALISTMPLDITLTWLGKKDWANGLTHRYAAFVTEEEQGVLA
jgi:protoporphyrinogen oxidase